MSATAAGAGQPPTSTTESLVNKHAIAHEEVEDFGRRWMLGAGLMIVADIAFVLAISFVFLYLFFTDTGSGFHPAKLPEASLGLTWAVTLLMVAGTVTYGVGLGRQVQPGARFVRLGWVSVLLMLLALVLNVVQMYRLPFSPTDNAYAGGVMLLAGANCFHLLLTLLLGTGAVNRARLGLTAGHLGWHMRIVGVWYGWVSISAVVVTVVLGLADSATR